MNGPNKVICSWCGRLIRDGDNPTSHGICPACVEELERNPHRPVRPIDLLCPRDVDNRSDRP